MRRASIVSHALLALAAAAGCRTPVEADCGATARAWADLSHRQLAADADRERAAQGDAMVPALRENVFERCNDEAWSLATRRCVIAATDAPGLERCAPTAAPVTAPSPSP